MVRPSIPEIRPFYSPGAFLDSSFPMCRESTALVYFFLTLTSLHVIFYHP
jgi:hypothetical protein